MKAINDAHQAEYGCMPDIVAKAPGRFHFMGEHSWFFKDKTLSMAINIPVYVAVSKRDDSTVKFYFTQLDDRKHASISSLKVKKEDKWANSIKAVIYGFTSGGFEVSGLNITIYSQILPSSGFGITTAIKVAAALAIKNLYSFNCTDAQLLQVLERANRKFLNQNNYISDIYTALFAKKDNLILTNHSTQKWDYIPFTFSDRKVILTDTNVPRISVWNEESIFEPEYALMLGDLREDKNNVYGGWKYINNITDINEILSVVSEDTHRKLVSIMREHGDILECVDALNTQDFFKFARAVNHSHETMRDYYNISCPEIDWILKRIGELEPNLDLVTNPVSCGRITGKGFGRCVYAIMRQNDVEKMKAKLSEFEKIFGFKTQCYEVVPSDGASIVRD